MGEPPTSPVYSVTMRRVGRPFIWALAAAAALSGCEQKRAADVASSARSTLPTGATAVLGPDDGQWVMPARDYASTRYSGLDQITTDNVARLQVAWTFSTGVNRGQEAAPVVVGTTMY